MISTQVQKLTWENVAAVLDQAVFNTEKNESVKKSTLYKKLYKNY